MTTMVFVAHADDEVIGAGGTVAKLAERGEEVIVVVFSHGHGFWGRLLSWPPLIEGKKLKRKREIESRAASEILGTEKVYFLDIKEEIGREFDESDRSKIEDLIDEYQPERIMYHSINDGHKHHRFVSKKMNEIMGDIDIDPEVLNFNINLFKFSVKNPSIVFDVSDVYGKKMKALKRFKTQKVSIKLLKPLILFKDNYFGRQFGHKYAEYFVSE